MGTRVYLVEAAGRERSQPHMARFSVPESRGALCFSLKKPHMQSGQIPARVSTARPRWMPSTPDRQSAADLAQVLSETTSPLAQVLYEPQFPAQSSRAKRKREPLVQPVCSGCSNSCNYFCNSFFVISFPLKSWVLDRL